MTSRDIIKVAGGGWLVLRQVKGSHHQYTHPTKPGRVTVKHPVKDMPKGTLHNIEKQAQLKLQ